MATSSAESVMYCPTNVADLKQSFQGILKEFGLLLIKCAEWPTQVSVWAGTRWLMMRTGHLNNGFIMTMTSLTYSQQSTAHFCVGLITLFFYPAFFIMSLFLDMPRRWECLPDTTSCKTGEVELKSFGIRPVHCAWAGVAHKTRSLTLWVICCTMATLYNVGQQAVMMDRVALMWWTWYSYPCHWEPPPHHADAQTNHLMDFQTKVC